MDKLRKIYIKLGRQFHFLEDLHIQQLDNGFTLHNKFYRTLDELMVDLKKELEELFKIKK